MNITVRIRNVYGIPLVYPVCAKAIALADLAGKKTFTTHDIALMKKLDISLIVEQQTLEGMHA